MLINSVRLFCGYLPVCMFRKTLASHVDQFRDDWDSLVAMQESHEQCLNEEINDLKRTWTKDFGKWNERIHVMARKQRETIKQIERKHSEVSGVMEAANKRLTKSVLAYEQQNTEGEVTAYWNRVADLPLDSALGKLSARRSHLRSAMPDDWKRIGLVHDDMLRKQWPEVASVEQASSKWVEWGCGGGANVARLRKIACVWGVDLCNLTLEVCSVDSGDCTAHTDGKFVPMLADFSNPEAICDSIHGFDGFLSTATFQHFPSKAYTERIVSMIRKMLRPCGYVMIQIRRISPQGMMRDPSLPYADRAMVATSYGVEEFRDLLHSHQITVERTEDREDMGRQYTYFFGRVR